MGRVQFVELKVGGVPRAVAHHQHRDLVWARATRRADTAASARRPQQVALAPAGLQKEGFIGFQCRSRAYRNARLRRKESAVATERPCSCARRRPVRLGAPSGHRSKPARRSAIDRPCANAPRRCRSGCCRYAHRCGNGNAAGLDSSPMGPIAPATPSNAGMPANPEGTLSE